MTIDVERLARIAEGKRWRAWQHRSHPGWWWVEGLKVDGPEDGRGDFLSKEDAELVAAAPEMARMLAELLRKEEK